jgi:hypothetical protein
LKAGLRPDGSGFRLPSEHRTAVEPGTGNPDCTWERLLGQSGSLRWESAPTEKHSPLIWLFLAASRLPRNAVTDADGFSGRITDGDLKD